VGFWFCCVLNTPSCNEKLPETRLKENNQGKGDVRFFVDFCVIVLDFLLFVNCQKAFGGAFELPLPRHAPKRD
jgi:hypothetical protein